MLIWILKNLKTVLVSFVGSALLYLCMLIIRSEKSFAEIKEIKEKTNNTERIVYTITAQYGEIEKQLKEIKQELKEK